MAVSEQGRELRDRDDRGRARNARPRDSLGRPLPYGVEGVTRVPEDLVLAPLEALAEAQRLLDQDLPFHAHEILEGTWKAAPSSERELWQGLAQLAVGLTHVRRGNPAGAVTLLSRGRSRVERYREPGAYGIDITGLVAWADDALVRLAAQPPNLAIRTPQLLA